ncbi:ABC transporter [Candidatus Saccharibacteria bacterium]|nr:MAG: ABC transporter [Candidatus Saccharibacteria bacterium]
MNQPISPRIRLTGVSKRFGIGDAEHFALDNVDLTVEKGEFITIMGPSGCGKTTLLNIIGLLDRPTDGEYHLDDRPVDSLSSRKQAKLRSEHIGFVFQNFNLIPRLTVIENVSLPLTYKGAGKTRRLQEASRILKNFHLGEREYYMPHQLSGGQTQRVAIARALVNSPSIILADEPTGNLDSKTSHIIMEELADIHRRGNTIIMVTHNPDLTSYASRVITMLDGKIDTDKQQAQKAPFTKKLIVEDKDDPEKEEIKVSKSEQEKPKEDSAEELTEESKEEPKPKKAKKAKKKAAKSKKSHKKSKTVKKSAKEKKS